MSPHKRNQSTPSQAPAILHPPSALHGALHVPARNPFRRQPPGLTQRKQRSTATL
jgi:hypothetical protein